MKKKKVAMPARAGELASLEGSIRNPALYALLAKAPCDLKKGDSVYWNDKGEPSRVVRKGKVIWEKL